MQIVWALTILALMLLGQAPEHGWGVRVAQAQGNAAADIEAAIKKTEQLYTQGQRQAALALTAETLKRAQSALGEKHPATLLSISNYAFLLNELGRAREALPYNERALKLRTEVLGEKHPDTLVSLSNYAATLSALGREADALPYYERALKLGTEVRGAKHPATLITLSNYANLLRTLGRAAEALPYHERALKLRTEVLGEKHPDTLTSLHNYAAALQALGRAAEALPHVERVLKLRTEVLGEKHPNTLGSLGNYTFMLNALGRTAEALPYNERALNLSTEVLGEKHPGTLRSLNNYAQALNALGRTAEALPHLERALKLSTEVLGENHPNTLTLLSNYAGALHALGRTAEALPHGGRLLKLRSELLGEKHPDTLLALINYTIALQALGRRAEALPYYERFIAGAEAQRHEAGRDSAESQRSVLGSYLFGYHYYLITMRDTGRVHEALGLLERTKARTLLEQMALRSAATGSGLPEAEARKLLDYSNRIGALDTRIAQTPQDQEREALKAERNAASRALAELKRALQARHPRFRQITEVRLATAEDARTLLPANGIFVSYVVIRGTFVKALTLNAAGKVAWFDIADLPGLADTVEALRMWTANLAGGVMVDDTGRTIRILRWMEGKTPRWRVIAAGQACSAQQMQRDKQQNESTLTRGLDLPVAGNAGADCIPPGATFVSREAQYQELINYLGKALLDPLQSQLAGKQQLIISPDGPLGLVPWDVLPLNGKPLIAQFDVSQVQSLSVLKLLKERQAEYGKNKARDALLAMGNPEYGNAGVAPDRGKGMTMKRSPFTRQSTGNPAEMLRKLKWANLPGTQVEMDRAAKIFGGQSRVVSGKAASETTLRRLSTGGELAQYRYLLFAAHGYFDPNFPAYSSLVLAPEGTEPERDGYVTMGEWVGMNLRSELTLLSACNTARGENISGEGLMGLAYALYVAGNTNTVLTLWPVADEETADFVSSLLTKIKAGQPHAQAITATKREFINHDIPRKRNPYFWAPFVLYGM
jgi:CHAT domain-containing protein